MPRVQLSPIGDLYAQSFYRSEIEGTNGVTRSAAIYRDFRGHNNFRLSASAGLSSDRKRFFFTFSPMVIGLAPVGQLIFYDRNAYNDFSGRVTITWTLLVPEDTNLISSNGTFNGIDLRSDGWSSYTTLAGRLISGVFRGAITGSDIHVRLSQQTACIDIKGLVISLTFNVPSSWPQKAIVLGTAWVAFSLSELNVRNSNIRDLGVRPTLERSRSLPPMRHEFIEPDFEFV